MCRRRFGGGGHDMMGSGEADPGSEIGSGEEVPLASLVPCSICLEPVKDGGERSTAKLQCGHRFHLGQFPTMA